MTTVSAYEAAGTAIMDEKATATARIIFFMGPYLK
jgi:hypothetical protein